MNPTDSHAPISVYDHSLRELVNVATKLAGRARRARLDWQLRQLRAAGHTLHAARDLLDQIGVEYIDAARAYIAAGTQLLQDLEAEIDRHEITRGASERVTAHDVIAWFEHHGIQFTAAQSFRIERLLNA